MIVGFDIDSWTLICWPNAALQPVRGVTVPAVGYRLALASNSKLEFLVLVFLNAKTVLSVGLQFIARPRPHALRSVLSLATVRAEGGTSRYTAIRPPPTSQPPRSISRF